MSARTYPEPADVEAAIVREQRRAEWWADASDQQAEHNDAMRAEGLDRDGEHLYAVRREEA